MELFVLNVRLDIIIIQQKIFAIKLVQQVYFLINKYNKLKELWLK